MFENLGAFEVGLLLLVALLIFGDRLPKVISDGLRMVRNLRNMANNATGDLSRELGTDIKLEDLHPKAFIRKHLLSEEDEAAIRKPIQGVYDNLRSDITGVHNELKDVAAATDFRSGGTKESAVTGSGTASGTGGSATGGSAIGGATASGRGGYDVDAT
ncbi:preprotein translocase subunit TatB [Plantactinospora sp. GCM10030261]|uniref:preprotein translocase subunit TatB n=1 Tax=Plantactinospora sp. GCM10030261 TaxID=3273420 RepID=UPI00361FC997